MLCSCSSSEEKENEQEGHPRRCNLSRKSTGKCDDHTESKLEDRIREDTNLGKYEEQLIKIEENPTERTQSQEDLSDSEIDREEDAEPTSYIQPRNPSETDPCLYIRERKGRKLLIVLYVDDGLIAATDQQNSEMFIKELKTKFKTSVGEVSCFLGLKLSNIKATITISQKGYARKILKCFGFEECKPVVTPILKDCRLQKPETKNSDFPYREAAGALMYLMVGTRLDIAYSVGFFSRSLENPSSENVVRVKRVFRYIAGTVGYGITYHATVTKGVLHCFSDSDFGGCTKTSRSTSGYVMIYAGGDISRRSQRQAIVATSTTESEVIASSEAAKEIIWLCRLIRCIVN
ncbi:copia protein [Trichonephila inaurata madagascariensis]|uniref:Copia protein n=1 Tax=Trichonephila inaurata madagascariensis TaxID=2747483 RepID=A0A8X6X6I9_9ARAC|nr:copia protein [Trichonephila inaurata madagascariensis]